MRYYDKEGNIHESLFKAYFHDLRKSIQNVSTNKEEVEPVETDKETPPSEETKEDPADGDQIPEPLEEIPKDSQEGKNVIVDTNTRSIALKDESGHVVLEDKYDSRLSDRRDDESLLMSTGSADIVQHVVAKNIISNNIKDLHGLTESDQLHDTLNKIHSDETDHTKNVNNILTHLGEPDGLIEGYLNTKRE